MPEEAFLSDANRHLIETYAALKKDWKSIVVRLEGHQHYHSDQYYYEVRDRVYGSEFDRAAQFIYLNRTCWNGLYRENLAGRFNVPKGTKSTVISPEDNFAEVSNALNRVELTHGDFEKTLDNTREGDLVFIDPPYTVKHNQNGFLKYNEKIFSWDDQVRLRDQMVRKAKEGVRFIATNAYHPSIVSLYENVANLIPLERHSILSGKSQYRASTQEALITIGVHPDDVLDLGRARIFSPPDTGLTDQVDTRHE